MPPRKGLARFVVRVLFWLAPCFVAWYFASPLQMRPVGWLAGVMVDMACPAAYRAVEHEERSLRFVTRVESRDASGDRGSLLIDVDPQVYTYGTAILVALMLASAGGWGRIVAGLFILMPFQAWGIAFDVLAQVIRTGPGAAMQAGLTGWKGEAAALGYQLGSLVFPAIMPVIVWSAMQRRFVEELVGANHPTGEAVAGTNSNVG